MTSPLRSTAGDADAGVFGIPVSVLPAGDTLTQSICAGGRCGCGRRVVSLSRVEFVGLWPREPPCSMVSCFGTFFPIVISSRHVISFYFPFSFVSLINACLCSFCAPLICCPAPKGERLPPSADRRIKSRPAQRHLAPVVAIVRSAAAFALATS